MADASLSFTAEQIGDAADCMREAITTLRLLERTRSDRYGMRISKLILSVAKIQQEMQSLKGEIHKVAYTPTNSVFSLASAPLTRYGSMQVEFATPS